MRHKKLIASVISRLTFAFALILISVPPAFAFPNCLPVFCEGNAYNSAIYANNWIYSGLVGSSMPTITSIQGSWLVPAGDTGIIKYRDANGKDMTTISTIDSTNVTNNTFTVTPPSGAAYALLILSTGNGSVNRWLWFNQISFSDGSTDVFYDPSDLPNNPIYNRY